MITPLPLTPSPLYAHPLLLWPSLLFFLRERLFSPVPPSFFFFSPLLGFYRLLRFWLLWKCFSLPFSAKPGSVILKRFSAFEATFLLSFPPFPWFSITLWDGTPLNHLQFFSFLLSRNFLWSSVLFRDVTALSLSLFENQWVPTRAICFFLPPLFFFLLISFFPVCLMHFFFVIEPRLLVPFFSFVRRWDEPFQKKKQFSPPLFRR